MTNEQAISIMTIQRPRTGTKEKLEAYDMAIKSLEQKTCEDCISREEAIKACYGMVRCTGIDEVPYEYARDVLSDLPSVTPQPKVGEWLKNGEFCKCSNCHSLVLRSVVKSYNYCFRCGAKMEVEKCR